MNEEKYVAAIEISSSKIIAVVGKLLPSGELDILACEQEKGVESVRYGVIQNLEDTSMRIQRLLEKIERRPAVAPREITGVFTGLSGRSVRSISTEVKRNLPEDTEITDSIIDSLRKDALQTAIDSSLEVVDAIPRIYTVGKQETTSPKGAVGNRISAVYDLIVCRPEIRRNLMRTLPDKLGISINGAIVTALSSSMLVLTAEEKRLGCMLVDLGAETTTVTIYKNGHLRYFATIPIGGRNITRDITSLNTILEERAEEMKITSGDAISRDSISTLNINGVRLSDVSNLVVARAEEIVANIVEQISYAGLTERDLPGGIICIGGGSQLRGMTELLGNQSGLSVRIGQLPNYIHIEDSKVPHLEAIEVIGVLYAGATNSDAECLRMPHRDELPVTGQGNVDEPEEEVKPEKRPKSPGKIGNFFSRMGTKVSSFFTGNDDDDSDLIE